jgi:hypothetical protein
MDTPFLNLAEVRIFTDFGLSLHERHGTVCMEFSSEFLSIEDRTNEWPLSVFMEFSFLPIVPYCRIERMLDNFEVRKSHGKRFHLRRA